MKESKKGIIIPTMMLFLGLMLFLSLLGYIQVKNTNEALTLHIKQQNEDIMELRSDYAKLTQESKEISASLEEKEKANQTLLQEKDALNQEVQGLKKLLRTLN